MPLNNKQTLTQRQRSVSSDRGSQEEGDEGLEEPLRAKKRRESQNEGKSLLLSFLSLDFKREMKLLIELGMTFLSLF